MDKIIKFSGMSFLLILFWAVGLSNIHAADATQNTVEEKFPGLAMSMLKSATLTDMESEMLLKADGIEIRSSELEKILEQMPADTRKQWEKSLFFILEQESVEKLLLHQAVKDGISTKDRTEMEVIQAYLNQKAEHVSVSDAEAKLFYDNNKEMVGGIPFEQVKDSIQPFMLNQKKQDVIDDYLSSLGKIADIRVNRDWVEIQNKRVKDNPVDKARASGKPTMAEFGATGCIPCDMMQPILDNLRKKFGDRLNVVFVHVRENQVLGARFGIRSIPVQVFYDKDGKEVFRHTGFYAEADVMKQIEKLGVQ